MNLIAQIRWADRPSFSNSYGSENYHRSIGSEPIFEDLDKSVIYLPLFLKHISTWYFVRSAVCDLAMSGAIMQYDAEGAERVDFYPSRQPQIPDCCIQCMIRNVPPLNMHWASFASIAQDIFRLYSTRTMRHILMHLVDHRFKLYKKILYILSATFPLFFRPNKLDKVCYTQPPPAKHYVSSL